MLPGSLTTAVGGGWVALAASAGKLMMEVTEAAGIEPGGSWGGAPVTATTVGGGGATKSAGCGRGWGGPAAHDHARGHAWLSGNTYSWQCGRH